VPPRPGWRASRQRQQKASPWAGRPTGGERRRGQPGMRRSLRREM